MTVFRTALIALAVAASLGPVSAFAATSDAGDAELGERACVFVADLGGYVCEDLDAGTSLSELGDARKKGIVPPMLPEKL